VAVDAEGAVRSVEASPPAAGLGCAQLIVQRCEQSGTGEPE
jgi:hypothetical protein